MSYELNLSGPVKRGPMMKPACPAPRRRPTFRRRVASGPSGLRRPEAQQLGSYGAYDLNLGGTYNLQLELPYGGWFKKLKKAISLKNIGKGIKKVKKSVSIKNIKKLAPLAAGLIPGGSLVQAAVEAASGDTVGALARLPVPKGLESLAVKVAAEKARIKATAAAQQAKRVLTAEVGGVPIAPLALGAGVLFLLATRKGRR